MGDEKIFIDANHLLADSLRLGMQVIDSGRRRALREVSPVERAREPPPALGILTTSSVAD